ncbi:splicing factor [Coemansia sp. RSA 1972]|nr:splicing factor [Coemansia sp. RSA 1972]
MSDEIDVDALLDAPFKHKVVEDQSAKADAQMSPTNAKVEPAHAEDKTRVERKDTERMRRSESGSSRREHRDDRYRDSYRHSRHDRDRDLYRHSRHDRDRYYDRRERGSSRRSSSRYRQRSSSPPRSTSRDRRSRHRTPSRDRRSRHRSPSRDRRSRHRTLSKDQRSRRSPSPEVDESERDLRTVFAMQLSSRLRRSDLVGFFSQAGRVRDAHIVSEKGSRRSRGVAYVEFYAVESAVKARTLSGQRLLEVPIIVQPSEAEKNRKSTMRQYNASGAPVNAPVEENCLVVVRELLVDIAPSDIQRLFDLFGTVDHCRVAPAESDSKEPEWTAYIRFSTHAPARRAVEKLSGLALFGTKLRVRMARKSEQERELRRISEKAGSPMDITPKAELTAEPKRKLTAESNVDPAQTCTVLLLQNMVNPEEETEDNWREELGQDVRGECDKFGAISRVFVDNNPCDIYVEFTDASSALYAQQSMNGRWFGGRQITAFTQRPCSATSQHSEDSSLLKNVDCETPEQSYESTLEREFEVHDIGNLVEVGDLEPAFSFRKLLRFAGPGFAM